MSAGMHIRSFLVFVTRAVLLAAFAMASLAVVAERHAPDRHAGIMDVVPVALPDNCMKTCNDAFIKALQDEYTQHKNVVKTLCGGNFVCHRDENYRHRTALQSILVSHKTCRNGCSPQGASSAGT